MDFLPLKVIHDVKYSCWEPQFIGKIERNKILVFTKACLAEFFLSGKLQKLIHAKLKHFANFWPHKTFDSISAQISKLINLNSISFSEFSMCVTYKLLRKGTKLVKFAKISPVKIFCETKF